MSLFKKNTHSVDLLNKFMHLENKMDILHKQFDSFISVNPTPEQENKIYSELKIYIDHKLAELKNCILQNAKECFEPSTSNLEPILKSLIEDIYNKKREEILDTLQRCSEKHMDTNSNNISTLFKQMVETLENKFTSILTTQDLSLRTDLQSYLIGVKEDISKTITQQSNISINHVQDLNTQLTKHIKDLQSYILGIQDEISQTYNHIIIENHRNPNNDIIHHLNDLKLHLKDIDKNINSFYYENELVKHQLLLAEEIRQYSDEIQCLKTLALSTKESINHLLQ